MSSSSAKVFIRPRHAGPSIGRHPWLFAGAVSKLEGSPRDGQAVRVYREEDRKFIAHGLYNSKSQIRVRLYSWDENEEISDALLIDRLNRAFELRLKNLKFSEADSFRVIFSESDEISGLVVDKFGPYLSIQIGALALKDRLPLIVETLQKRFNPKGIKIRSDRSSGLQEGLALDTSWIGEEPTEAFEISDGKIKYWVDLRSGQKTGFYLDQRENRFRIEKYCEGANVLDLYCYTGGFSLHALAAGAKKATGVDSSMGAIELAEKNADLNQFSNAEFIEEDVSDFLTQQSQTYDVVICDPPRFSPGRREVDSALRKYFHINEAAIQKVKPGGILVTCSCSGGVSAEDFIQTLAGVSRRTGRSIQILEKSGASSDHPVLASCPESEYLKVILARVI